jgi:uncharacterized protein YaiI (UPF0178 family)
LPIIFSSRNGRPSGRQYYAEGEENDNVAGAGQRAFPTVSLANRSSGNSARLRNGRVVCKAMPAIFVDADACPVKAETELVAARHQLVVYMVSNRGLRPGRNPLVRNIVVAEGADAADDWIADHIDEDDIAVTADIPLASRCLKKGARVLGPSGTPFTSDSIGHALAMRDLNRHLRETSRNETYHAGLTKQDRSRFLGALENEIAAIRRDAGSRP